MYLTRMERGFFQQAIGGGVKEGLAAAGWNDEDAKTIMKRSSREAQSLDMAANRGFAESVTNMAFQHPEFLALSEEERKRRTKKIRVDLPAQMWRENRGDMQECREDAFLAPPEQPND